MAEQTPSTTASSEAPAETTAQTTEGTQQTDPKTYSQDEYDRYGQSQASKGKNDLLKSMGVNSVQEVLDMRARNEELSAKMAEQEQKISELNGQVSQANNIALLTKLGISEDHFDDVIILAKAKQGSESFADTVTNIAKANPQWMAHSSFGAQEGNAGRQSEGVPDDLKKKYPYLH